MIEFFAQLSWPWVLVLAWRTFDTEICHHTQQDDDDMS